LRKSMTPWPQTRVTRAPAQPHSTL
jgi:hypothetical protein